jgi:hypothetical protein
MTDFSTTKTIKHKIEYRKVRWDRDIHLFWMRGGGDNPERQSFLAVKNRLRDRLERVRTSAGHRGFQIAGPQHGTWNVINA